jgi:hypothetical protein
MDPIPHVSAFSLPISAGSILVVGGEEGSNGAPVPSLEIVPKPAGVTAPLYCDFLERTDPYNLYPFLAVLPSGGVFIAYYNEARILDDTTLLTIETLPNIPGAVNDFLAGRSYPMEGTAVLLPQYAPYTDPLTILICGGSTIGPEIALDNCVSLQPEVPNANWTIERMVSVHTWGRLFPPAKILFPFLAFPTCYLFDGRPSRRHLPNHEWGTTRLRRLRSRHRA